MKANIPVVFDNLYLYTLVEVFLQNIVQAWQALAGNKLRTFLSLLGITIGIFCIVSITTLFDSLQRNVSDNMKSLGSNVLYVCKYPWIPEDDGEYQWWKYKARPICTYDEVKLIERNATLASFASICYSDEAEKISFNGNEVSGVATFAVSNNFNKLQPIDIADGRYFSLAEMQNGQSNAVVIGSEVANELFGNNISPLGKSIKIFSRNFQVVGVMKKQGRSMTGFNFDNGIILSYLYLASFRNIDRSFENWSTDPLLMVKSKNGASLRDMKYEIKSILRAHRKIKPSEKDNFSFNQLDVIQNSINEMFQIFNVAGWIIGFFSLLVGCFGIANIMFVSVKERTPQIGIKKAIGARSISILTEFLIEAILLCIIGGLLGIGFVMLLSKFLTGAMEFPVYMSLGNFILGIGVSVVVGIIAGIIPALRASKLNPVVAIRS
ncbi:MAG: ABC transporter permease [Chitinophagaceae bacterium]|nr:ABC transporter permease [Chitinophagaceae bacterium]